ncbi:hypothetical protein RclHR1_00940011 [Rhizophagus clarus]|uniref:BTB domain-containing protein n=1 Tax=Rhizophagus clarus TaxID=94130 RepID=A0A2Z6SHL7_9GLOM|nr:hypothetical protein RclHR1_00940011 [Rhizophagus clarus]
MSENFFTKLSQNLIELLEGSICHDIKIEVGEAPNAKIFFAHTNILCYRSPYLREILASNENKDDGLSHVKLPNITPEIFQIILRYIYGGIFSLNGQDNLKIIEILLAADEFFLQEIVDHLQKYLIENKSDWIAKNFEFIHRISFKSNHLFKLQQFCTDFMEESPEKVFKSLDFTSLPEKLLIQLLKKDDLQMKEIEIWEHVLKWGLAQNPTSLLHPDNWSDDEFRTMKNILNPFIPSIRFFSLSYEEIIQKVTPYKKLLNQNFYDNLLASHLDLDKEPNKYISPPRNIKVDGININSKIINNLNLISTISKWIDKIVINMKFEHLRELYLPYKFKLILRGSRDGFTPKKFHELCDDLSCTVTFIKVKYSEEIIGGYNPIIWKNAGTGSYGSFGETKDSFIFSFKNNRNVKDAIISNVKNSKKCCTLREVS